MATLAKLGRQAAAYRKDHKVPTGALPSRPSSRGARRAEAKKRVAPKLTAKERKLLGGRHISGRNARLVNAYGTMVGARIKTGRREFMYLGQDQRAKMRRELVDELVTAARAGGPLRAWVIKASGGGAPKRYRADIARAKFGRA